MKFATKNNISIDVIERLLIEVDRLKSFGNLSDGEILVMAIKKVL